MFHPSVYASLFLCSGANEGPAVNTSATGVALIRITSDNKLYSKVTVSTLDAGDAVTVSQIHSAAAGVNGAVIQDLCSTAADFGAAKVTTPSTAILNSIKNDALYVNVHSTSKPSGLIRGQIR